MMGFRTLALTYLLGGLTFLPLVCAAVLATAWYLLPRTQHADDRRAGADVSVRPGDADAVGEEQQKRSRQESFGDTGASGTFAVLRQYDFTAAVGALNARNSTGSNANVSADGSLVADTGTSESVYQSMYRSVFVGKKDVGSSPLLDNPDTQHSSATRRKTVPANVMYIVLRHGHLMLYDSPAQVEVKHVISLAHHRVTLQADGDGEPQGDEKTIMEADLFTKRTAIVLTPVELPNGALQPSGPKSSRPFYLFCGTNIDKEDFYHALLAARTKPPTPRPLDTDALIKLQSALHSSSLTPETRALSALLGRVFLGIHKTDVLVDFVRSKIEKKLRKIQKPSFIPLLEIRSLDLGDAGPVVSNMKLKDLNISGDTTVSADVKYNGGLSLTLLAVAKLDLGPRFKVRTVDLILKTTLHRVSGTLLLRVKPVPSNRIWFCFESMPDLDVRVEPVVSERKITYGFVLRAIEERVRAAFAEGLVKPNWDDVPMPLQDTRGSNARGGVWSDEGEEDHPIAQGKTHHGQHEKRLSTTTLPDMNSATSTGLSSSSDSNLTKLRHTSTMPVKEDGSKRRPGSSLKEWHEAAAIPDKSPRPPKPFRSPSISGMSASVAVDDQSVERADDATIRGSPTPPSRLLWRSRGSPSFQQTQKDAMEELRELRNRAEQAVTKPSAVAINDADSARRSSDPDYHGDVDAHDSDSVRSRQHSDGSDSTIAATSRSFSLRSADSERSSNTSYSSSTLPRSQQLQQKKTTILAAAGAATSAARNWGWNTIQKNKGAFPRPGGRPDQAAKPPHEPMGRGQPLPPPGVPLPGPQKGVWGGMSNMRRKPVPALPPRRPRAEAEQSSSVDITKHDLRQTSDHDSLGAPAEDEFGTWQENAGDALTGTGSHNFSAAVPAQENSYVAPSHEEDLLDLEIEPDKTQSGLEEPNGSKKAPPPLPARRIASTSEASFPETTAAPSPPTIEINGEATSALRIPESAATLIATENATIRLALGAADDTRHIDHSSIGAMEPMDEEPPKGEMVQRFVRGEDVAEDDFEREEVINDDQDKYDDEHHPADRGDFHEYGASQHLTNDDLIQRIKAQVQRHNQHERNSHGADQDTASNVDTS